MQSNLTFYLLVLACFMVFLKQGGGTTSSGSSLDGAMFTTLSSGMMVDSPFQADVQPPKVEKLTGQDESVANNNKIAGVGHVFGFILSFPNTSKASDESKIITIRQEATGGVGMATGMVCDCQFSTGEFSPGASRLPSPLSSYLLGVSLLTHWYNRNLLPDRVSIHNFDDHHLQS
jgi:hypothetical protein